MFLPTDFWRPMLQMGRIAAEAQTVIALRMAGFAGFWPMTPVEGLRMVTEKIEAGQASAEAALRASLAGQGPAEVAMAAMRPVRAKTRANARRLKARAARD